MQSRETGDKLNPNACISESLTYALRHIAINYNKAFDTIVIFHIKDRGKQSSIFACYQLAGET